MVNINSKQIDLVKENKNIIKNEATPKIYFSEFSNNLNFSDFKVNYKIIL